MKLNLKSKFTLIYSSLLILAVTAVALGWQVNHMREKLDKIPVPLTETQKVEKAVSASYAAYFQSKSISATVDDSKSTCVKAATTKFTCSMHLVNTSTGKTLDQKLTVTYTDSAGITNIVVAK